MTGVLQGIIGRGEFLEPESGLATRVAELGVARQYHQNVHSLDSGYAARLVARDRRKDGRRGAAVPSR